MTSGNQKFTMFSGDIEKEYWPEMSLRHKLRDDTNMSSMKIIQFWRTPTPLLYLRPKFFHSLDLGFNDKDRMILSLSS